MITQRRLVAVEMQKIADFLPKIRQRFQLQRKLGQQCDPRFNSSNIDGGREVVIQISEIF